MTRLAVAFVLPSFAGGGAERAVTNLVRALPRDRFDPSLVVLDGRGPLASALADRARVVDLGTPRLRYGLPRLRRALAELDPDVIVPTVRHLNLAVLGLRPLLPRGVRILPREANLSCGSGALARALARLLYPTAERVLCPARCVAAEVRRRWAVPAERIGVLPNPVDVVAVRAAAAAPLRRPGPGRRLVAAGRLTAQKGFDRLIELVPRLAADDRLAILGEGPDRESLLAQASRLGVGGRVELPGFVAEPWRHFAGADGFLLPSRWEGMPNAALEALACGAPVVAAPEAGGIGELVEETPPGAVVLADVGDPFLAAIALSQAVTAFAEALCG
jgi:glycosyltransferase involved in cell wall biosynthesis